MIQKTPEISAFRSLSIYFLVGVLSVLAVGVTIYSLRSNVEMGVAQKDQEPEASGVMSEQSVPEGVLPEANPEIPKEVPSDKETAADEWDRTPLNQVLQNKPVADRIRTICKSFGIEVPTDITISIMESRPPFGEPMLKFATTKGKELKFDPNNGALLWLYSMNLGVQGGKSLGEKPALTAAEAADRLNEFGRAIGEYIQVSEEEAHYENSDPDNDPAKDPDNGQWSFAFHQAYKDVPIFESYVRAEVSAVDGEILFYSNRPQAPQEVDITVNVSQADAFSRTLDFINKMEQEIGVKWQSAGMGKKFIVYPNNCWTREEDTSWQRTGPPRCCWVEGFMVGPQLILVFVDTITGEIIGGM